MKKLLPCMWVGLALVLIVVLFVLVVTINGSNRCDYKVSEAGRIYAPGDRYYKVVKHKTNLCYDEALALSKTPLKELKFRAIK